MSKNQDAAAKAAAANSLVGGVGGKNVILVSEKQRGNPILKFIRNVQWEFSKDIVPDYVMGFTCAIFVSIKYHSLHSKHADLRIRELGKTFRLRILLVLVDVDDDISVKPLNELNKLCFNNDVTLLLCWSNEECARYLETLKLYENKSASSIQEKVTYFSNIFFRHFINTKRVVVVPYTTSVLLIGFPLAFITAHSSLHILSYKILKSLLFRPLFSSGRKRVRSPAK